MVPFSLNARKILTEKASVSDFMNCFNFWALYAEQFKDGTLIKFSSNTEIKSEAEMT